MRIAYLTNQYPAPSHTFIRREIVALEKRGHSVFRYAIRPFSGVLSDLEDIAEQGRTSYLLKQGTGKSFAAFVSTLLCHPAGMGRAARLAFRLGALPGGSFPRHIIYLAEAMILSKWCQEQGIDHLHVHFGTNPAAVAALANAISGVPFSFTVHGPEEFDRPRTIGLGLKARSASFVIGVSSFGRSQLMRWTGTDDWHKLHVVRCGLDERYRQEPTVPVPEERRLVCVARLGEQKGHLVLLQAAAHVRRDGISFKLVLAGNGPLRSEIEREVKRLLLEDVVDLIGTVDQDRVQAEIAASRAMVLASFAEGLPVVLMESMALGRPVISTYVAGIPELVQSENGWLVPAGDVDALADAMKAALTAETATLATMGTLARKHVLARHDISQSAAQIEELIVRAAEARASGLVAAASLQLQTDS
ncbi:glycosyltransferase family 4 protein (plasmid) [Rhizobium grahamii]|uniref:Glycosyltransferase family 4 protein n=1 Tax=Rhizobium grahamii TaxID=1120045 RepID=A0A5Q0CEG7_9HYPH|nr:MULTISPECIES: glycosyltransferase family 4 protein [Rhizobium]QFY63695.1 glycosyltransferase family 4 protein [Rhizobium grahamii]QRM51541.1 glycosyltransferase family 4 protein [Rhizobium sp. BG6]